MFRFHVRKKAAAERFDKAHRAVRADGTLKAIFDRFR
jgi:hypothetical protein